MENDLSLRKAHATHWRGGGQIPSLLIVLLALAALLFTWPAAKAEVAYYIPTQGRISAVDATGGRDLVSGVRLPSPGLIADHIGTGEKYFYVTDQEDHAVYLLNSETGMSTMLSGPGVGSGPFFDHWIAGIALRLLDNSLLVADGDDSAGLRALVKVDRETGDRQIFSAGSNSPAGMVGSGVDFQTPFGISIDSNQTAYVTDRAANTVLQVDKFTGARTIFSGSANTGPAFTGPAGIVEGSYVVDASPSLFRVAETGNRDLAASNLTNGEPIIGLGRTSSGYFQQIGYLLGAFGHLEPGDALKGYGELLGIDPLTGVSTTVSRGFVGTPTGTEIGSGPAFLQPIDVKSLFTGPALVSDALLQEFFLVDPATGNRNILPNSRKGSGPELLSPRGIVMLGGGTMAVASLDGTGRDPMLLQVDAATGDRSVLSAGANSTAPRGSGVNLVYPNGLALENDGKILVADAGTANPQILRVDPATGNRTVVSSGLVGSGVKLLEPFGLALESTGQLLVADSSLQAIVRIDPGNGNREIVSDLTHGSGFALHQPRGIAVLADGSLVVTDAAPARLFKIDPVSGNRVVFSDATTGTGPLFDLPGGVIAEDEENVLVVDGLVATGSFADPNQSALYRVNLATDNRSIVTNATVGAGPLLQTAPLFLATGDISAPEIITQPASASTFTGGSVTFSANATGSPAPAYQWQLDGKDLAGENSSTITLKNLPTGQSGAYRVVVSNLAGKTVSNTASVQVAPGYVISTASSPVAGGTTAGGGALAANSRPTVTATAAPNFVFDTWTEDGSIVSRVSSYTFTLTGSRLLVANFGSRIISLAGDLNFGNVTVRTTKTAVLTITNGGGTPLTVSSITYPFGSYSGNFSGVIPAGAAQEVVVTFKPSAATNYNGSVRVNCDQTAGSNTIAIAGTGIPTATRIVGLGGNLAYGSVAVGAVKTSTLVLKNTGNAPLNVTSITYPFGVYTGGFAGSIAAGATQNVTVTFKPVGAAPYNGNIRVNCDKTSGNNSIAVTGSGIAATRVIALSGNLTFGSVKVNSSKTAILAIKNTGNSPLTVASITYPFGTYTGAYSGTIAAGATQNVTVTFRPVAAIPYNGNVRVNAN